MTFTDIVLGWCLFYTVMWPQDAGHHLNIILHASGILP